MSSKFFSFSLLITLFFFSCGNYQYAEKYTFEVDDSTLVSCIREFKKQHRTFEVPDSVGLSDGKESYWDHIYFYYPDENQIVKTWVRSIEDGETTFALIAINDGLQLGHWKFINYDFNASENRNQKKNFESRILDPIRKQCSANQNKK